MKKTKIKSRMTFLSVLLALALIFTAMPLTASAENEEASAVNTGTSGEYTVSQLADMQVPDDDIPATLTRADIDAKGHAVRLKNEEPNDETVIFQNRDGSKTAYIYMTPVKYTDENGITRDKSSEITAFSGAYNGKHYAYAMKDNDVKVYFSRVGTDGITLSAAGYDIKMIPENTTSLLIPAATLVDENTLRYNGVYGLGTDIEYTSILNGVKENIVLSRYAGVNSYTFMLYTDGLALMNNGADYYLADTAGKRVASIGRVIAEDSAGNTVYGTMTAVTVRAGAQYIVNVAVDEEFLTDEDTVYPVKIDPTVTIDQGDTGYIYDRIQDTGLYGTNSALNGLTSNVYPVGYVSSTVGVGRMAIRFPMFVDPWADYMSQFYSGVADIKGYQISSASLSLYAKSVFGSTTVYVHPMTSAPTFPTSGREQNTTLMNSYSTAYSASATVSSAGRKSFDITSIVKQWAYYDFSASSGTLNPIHGLIVKNSDESDEMKGVEFYSAYYYDPNYQPELSITYEQGTAYYLNNSGSGTFLVNSNGSPTLSTYASGTSYMWFMDNVGTNTYVIRSLSGTRNQVLYNSNGTLSIAIVSSTSNLSSLSNEYKWIVSTLSSGEISIVSASDTNKILRYGTSLDLASVPTTIDAYSGYAWRMVPVEDYVNLTNFSVSHPECIGSNSTQTISISSRTPYDATFYEPRYYKIVSSNTNLIESSNGLTLNSKDVSDLSNVNITVIHKPTGISKTFQIEAVPIADGEFVIRSEIGNFRLFANSNSINYSDGVVTDNFKFYFDYIGDGNYHIKTYNDMHLSAESSGDLVCSYSETIWNITSSPDMPSTYRITGPNNIKLYFSTLMVIGAEDDADNMSRNRLNWYLEEWTDDGYYSTSVNEGLIAISVTNNGVDYRVSSQESSTSVILSPKSTYIDTDFGRQVWYLKKHSVADQTYILYNMGRRSGDENKCVLSVIPGQFKISDLDDNGPNDSQLWKVVRSSASGDSYRFQNVATEAYLNVGGIENENWYIFYREHIEQEEEEENQAGLFIPLTASDGYAKGYDPTSPEKMIYRVVNGTNNLVEDDIIEQAVQNWSQHFGELDLNIELVFPETNNTSQSNTSQSNEVLVNIVDKDILEDTSVGAVAGTTNFGSDSAESYEIQLLRATFSNTNLAEEYITSVITHELGHVLQLSHLYVEPNDPYPSNTSMLSVMNYSSNENDTRSPSWLDIENIKLKWGN